MDLGHPCPLLHPADHHHPVDRENREDQGYLGRLEVLVDREFLGLRLGSQCILLGLLRVPVVLVVPDPKQVRTGSPARDRKSVV